MTIQFTPYHPTFIDGSPLTPQTFDTEEALLASVIPQRFMQESFCGFEFSPDTGNLMAVYRGGKEWWVVGRVDPPLTSIPVWKPNES